MSSDGESEKHLEQDYISSTHGVFTIPYTPQDQPAASTSTVPALSETYESAWDKCSAIINRTLNELHSEVVDNIVQFVNFPSPDIHFELQQFAPPPIRTALIIGSGQTISSQLLGSLQKHLSDDLALLISLDSRVCTNTKNMMKAFIGGLVTAHKAKQPEEHYAKTTGRKPSILGYDDIQTLLSWYRHYFGDKDQKPKIVVFIKDFELFDPNVMQQFVYICSRYSHELPIVFLFGIATSVDAIYNLLSRTSLQYLVCDTIYVQPGEDTLNTLLYKVLLDPDLPLTIGPQTFASIYRAFQVLNPSIDNVISKLDYTHLLHYSSTYPNALQTLHHPLQHRFNATAVLHCADLEQTGEIDNINHLQSLMEDYEERVQLINTAQQIQLSYRKELQACMSVLEILCSAFGYQEMVKDTYNDDQEKKASKPLEKIDLLKYYYEGKLTAVASQVTRLFFEANDEKVQATLTQLNEARIANLPDVLVDELSSTHTEIDQLMETGQRGHQKKHFMISNKLSGMMAKSLTDDDKRFSKCVVRVVDAFNAALSEAFRTYQDLPLHQLWWFDDVKLLEEAFHPKISNFLHDTLMGYDGPALAQLSNPDQVPEEDEEVSPAHDDTSRAYRSLTLAGRNVNLADWFIAFSALADPTVRVVEGGGTGGMQKRTTREAARKRAEQDTDEDTDMDDLDDESEEDGEGKESKQQRLAARFVNAVSDLGHLGMVTGTKRKVEHVARTVWM